MEPPLPPSIPAIPSHTDPRIKTHLRDRNHFSSRLPKSTNSSACFLFFKCPTRGKRLARVIADEMNLPPPSRESGVAGPGPSRVRSSRQVIESPHIATKPLRPIFHIQHSAEKISEIYTVTDDSDFLVHSVTSSIPPDAYLHELVVLLQLKRPKPQPNLQDVPVSKIAVRCGPPTRFAHEDPRNNHEDPRNNHEDPRNNGFRGSTEQPQIHGGFRGSTEQQGFVDPRNNGFRGSTEQRVSWIHGTTHHEDLNLRHVPVSQIPRSCSCE